MYIYKDFKGKKYADTKQIGFINTIQYSYDKHFKQHYFIKTIS